VAAAGRLNVMGTQFHPEKSGQSGLRVYANFLDFCGAG
jgi:glutamine amidotransferase